MGKKTVRLNERQVKELIKGMIVESAMKEGPVMPLMNMAGRRESTNVEDRRGEKNSFRRYRGQIFISTSKVLRTWKFTPQETRNTITAVLSKDREIIERLSVVDALYRKAALYMGPFKTKIKALLTPAPLSRTRPKPSEENMPGDPSPFPPIPTPPKSTGNQYADEMKNSLIHSAELFRCMVNTYVGNTRRTDPDRKEMFKDIRFIYNRMKQAFNLIVKRGARQ